MGSSKVFVRGALLLMLSIGILAAPLVLTVGGTGNVRAEQPAITLSGPSAASNAILPPGATSTARRESAGQLVSYKAAPLQALADDVVISEFRTRGPLGDTDEFIELFNRSGSPIDISGWTIRSSSCDGGEGLAATIPTSPSLSVGQHYLIAGLGYVGSANYQPSSPDPALSLVDNGGLALFDGPYTTPDHIIDQVGFCGANPSDYFEGTPLATQIPSTADQSYDRGTTGGACQDTNNNATDFFLRTPSNPQTTLSPLNICSNPTPLPTNTPTASLTATASGPTPTPTLWPTRSVVINEVGWAGTGASTTDEWIELYHPGSGTVDLEGWELLGVRAGGIIQFDITFENTTTDTISIGNNNYLVLTANSSVFHANVASTWILTDPNLGLIDTGMTLYLYDPSHTQYVDTANLTLGGVPGAWPAGSTSQRRSMERINSNSADSQTNWATFSGTPSGSSWPQDSSGNPVYGSPGRANQVLTVTVTPRPIATATSKKKPTPIPPTPFGHMVINEFLPRAGTDWNQDGKIDVYDEFIELKNLGPIDVDLKNWKLDVEGSATAAPFTLPSKKLAPGERWVYYGSTTKLLQEDSGGTVRLLNPSGVVIDARGYGPVADPDQTHCRMPDGYYWTRPCFPTPGLQNSLKGTAPAPPPVVSGGPPPCLLADSVPAPFRQAECDPYGADMWDETYWDKQAGQGQFRVPDTYNKATTIVQ